VGQTAAFRHWYPEEVKNRHYIVALGKDSRWGDHPGYFHVPFVCVVGASRSFHLVGLDSLFSSDDFVLVSRTQP
jgi:hypothetical protein